MGSGELFPSVFRTSWKYVHQDSKTQLVFLLLELLTWKQQPRREATGGQWAHPGQSSSCTRYRATATCEMDSLQKRTDTVMWVAGETWLWLVKKFWEAFSALGTAMPSRDLPILVKCDLLLNACGAVKGPGNRDVNQYTIGHTAVVVSDQMKSSTVVPDPWFITIIYNHNLAVKLGIWNSMASAWS